MVRAITIAIAIGNGDVRIGTTMRASGGGLALEFAISADIRFLATYLSLFIEEKCGTASFLQSCVDDVVPITSRFNPNRHSFERWESSVLSYWRGVACETRGDAHDVFMS